jgi:hypothetical protein
MKRVSGGDAGERKKRRVDCSIEVADEKDHIPESTVVFSVDGFDATLTHISAFLSIGKATDIYRLLCEYPCDPRTVEQIKKDATDGVVLEFNAPTQRVITMKMFTRMCARYATSIEFALMGVEYHYSNQVQKTWPMPDWMEKLRQIASDYCGVDFNYCMVNYMVPTDQKRSNCLGEHRDDEKGLESPNIFCIVVGPQRELNRTVSMRWCPKKKLAGAENPNPTAKIQVDTRSGDVYMMDGKNFQSLFKHGVPGTTNKKKNELPRISLTYRKLTVQ